MRSYQPASRRTIRLGLAVLVLSLASLTAACGQDPPASYDIAANGATASGRVGDVVKVTVGITNKGPEKYLVPRGSSLTATWTFTPPPGTETVRPPANEVSTIFGSGGAVGADRCATMAGDSPFGRGPYECFTGPIFEPGASSKGTFYLKITKVVPNATGTVGRWDCTKPPANRRYYRECTETADDRNADNDEAEVIINPDSAATGGLAGRITPSTLALAAGLVVIVLAVGGWHYRRRRSAARQ